MKQYKGNTAQDVTAVVTSYNQGEMILEAVRSLYRQSTPPARIIIIDDGSTDKNSVCILNQLKSELRSPVSLTVISQPNSGVSAARNTGLRRVETPLALVLDGDDKLEPSYIEKVSGLLRDNPSMAAASSWMQTFGVLEANVCPSGGGISAFLARNCCPATHIHRHELWKQCGGYDESMRSGFEDWDFFLNILETSNNAWIGIVPEPLIDYRTAPASANIKSMTGRLSLMRYIIEKHNQSYHAHLADALLGIEAVSMSRLYGWENETLHTLEAGQSPGPESNKFIQNPSYGDGGMASAVRIASFLKKSNSPDPPKDE